jgi:phosphatidylinositol 4-kinase
LIPDFSEDRRDDLEFYVPQLCNFLLYRHFKGRDELLKCLLECCRSSFYFAHRMYWFLNSTNFDVLEQAVVEPNHFMKFLQLVTRDSHPIYLGHSADLYGLMLAMGLVDEATNSAERAAVRQIMERYEDLPPEAGKAQSEQVEIKSVPLQPFSYGLIADGFMSTVCFVEELTHISSALVGASDKRELLTQLLKELNKKLPAAVYLPLSMSSLHDCAVLHIPVHEVKIFVTKERAPFLICIEVYEPYRELMQ